MNNPSILFSEENIQNRIRELGRQITLDYQDKELPLIVISMLKGSTYFLADLTREIDLPLQFDFLSISKIQNSISTIDIVKDIEINIQNRHILVLEEIIRSGLTTHYMIEHIETFKPASINIASLLVNPDQMMIDLPLTYQGFEIDYSRVVGYGMDSKEDYRHLKYIRKLK